MMTRARRCIALCAIGAALACEAHQATGPVPGTLVVRLQNPNDGQDGAILFTLSGPAAPVAPAAASGDTLWGGPFAATTNRFVVTGGVRSGSILSFQVPDVGVASQYSVALNQVAASSGYGLRPLAGYSVTVGP
jgi:hypothetical protein